MNAAVLPLNSRRHRRRVFRTFVLVAAAMLLGSGVSFADEVDDATAPTAFTQVNDPELLVVTVPADGLEPITMSTNGTRIG